jgi:hypothetical protein
MRPTPPLPRNVGGRLPRPPPLLLLSSLLLFLGVVLASGTIAAQETRREAEEGEEARASALEAVREAESVARFVDEYDRASPDFWQRCNGRVKVVRELDACPQLDGEHVAERRLEVITDYFLPDYEIESKKLGRWRELLSVLQHHLDSSQVENVHLLGTSQRTLEQFLELGLRLDGGGGSAHRLRGHSVLTDESNGRRVPARNSSTPSMLFVVPRRHLEGPYRYGDVFAYANRCLRERIAVVTNADIQLRAGFHCLSRDYFLPGKQLRAPEPEEIAAVEARAIALQEEVLDEKPAHGRYGKITLVRVPRHHQGRGIAERAPAHRSRPGGLFGKRVVALSRSDHLGHQACTGYTGSHDTFVFVPPLPDSVAARLRDVPPNRAGAENVVLYELSVSGVGLSNPCYALDAHHVHRYRLPRFRASHLRVPAERAPHTQPNKTHTGSPTHTIAPTQVSALTQRSANTHRAETQPRDEKPSGGGQGRINVHGRTALVRPNMHLTACHSLQLKDAEKLAPKRAAKSKRFSTRRRNKFQRLHR